MIDVLNFLQNNWYVYLPVCVICYIVNGIIVSKITYRYLYQKDKREFSSIYQHKEVDRNRVDVSIMMFFLNPFISVGLVIYKIIEPIIFLMLKLLTGIQKLFAFFIKNQNLDIP